MENSLTHTQIKQAKAKDKPYDLADGKGLYLRIRPTGSKSWLFRYLCPTTNKKQNFTLGSYPEISLSDARQIRTTNRELLAKGIDPKLQKSNEAQQATNTVLLVAEKWLELKQTQITADYADDIRRSFELHLFPKLGKYPLTELTAPIVINTFKPIEAKGSHETVKRLCQRLNEVMTFALNSGIIFHNPLSGIWNAFVKPQKKHMPSLSPDQLPRFLNALLNANIRATTRNLIMWQLHTLARPSEAAGAMWCEINTLENIWVIPAERMKKKREHIVPLTQAMLAILERMKPISSNSEYIFPSDRNMKKPANSETANTAIRRMGFKGELVAHGLRSIGSTTLNEQGFDSNLIETALAHVDKDATRAAYNRAKYIEQRREMMEWWSQHIKQSLSSTF